MQLSSPATALQQWSVDDPSPIFQILEREDKLRQEMEAKAKADQDELRQEMETMRENMKPAPPPSVSDEQLATLQTRLEALHAAELLSEAELDALEDIVMEYVELKASLGASGGVHALAMSQAIKLVAISEAVATDGVFARQARRRFAA